MRKGFFAVLLALLLGAVMVGPAQAKAAAAHATLAADGVDTDGDGIPDALDACPMSPGPSGCPLATDWDNDGIPNASDPCPDTPGTTCDHPVDTDGDGIPDALDACPMSPGPGGCPLATDWDNDGIPNASDPCPTIPGTVCGTPADKDGDGVPDTHDACPSIPGPIYSAGCPVSPGPGGNGNSNVVDPCASPAGCGGGGTTVSAPAPSAPPLSPSATLSAPAPAPAIVTAGRGTKLEHLTVTKVPTGATVSVRCKGKGCPATLSRAVVKRNAHGTVSLTALVHRRVRAGTVFIVTIATSGAKRVTATVTIRASAAPVVKMS